MSFENGLDALKPSAKTIPNLDLINKFKSDLNFLETGKLDIEKTLAEKGIEDEVIDKKMRKLNRAIERLTKLINAYDKGDND